MIEAVRELLKRDFPNQDLKAETDDRGIVTLSGECEDWQQLIRVGHAVANVPGVRNVVSDMTAKGVTIPVKDYTPYIKAGKEAGVIGKVDVVIVGAGISGCGVARELSRYDLDICLVEMGDDVANAASKANNGDIHTGNAVKPGTLKAEMNVKGNAMYTKWAEELGFNLDRCGQMKVCTEEELVPEMMKSYEIAAKNGVPGIRKITHEEAVAIEPKMGVELDRIGKKAVAGIWFPSFGLVEPYEVCVKLAENAAKNGVKFIFDCTVADVLHENGEVKGVVTEKGIIEARYVINCAGVYGDEISAMAGDRCFTIHPRKGIIAILDKNAAPQYDCLAGIYKKAPKNKNVESKGGGMCRTPEMNILLGPSATEVPDKEDVETTPEDLEYTMGRNGYYKTGYGDIIRIFAGTRPADFKEDFIIEMSEKTHGFINVGAIQSPGVASAPAVAERTVNILKADYEKDGAVLKEKPDFDPYEEKRVEFRHMTQEQRDELIKKDPRYGKIICRCEQITEGEILDAIHSRVVPTSIDAIKRRTRAGMGRCQGGFCQPRVLEILARELGQDWVDITLKGRGSNILVSGNRDTEEGGRDE